MPVYGLFFNRWQTFGSNSRSLTQSPSDVDSIRSDLTSLSESIYSYVYENGRTYHAHGSGTYVCLPEVSILQKGRDITLDVRRLTSDSRFFPTMNENKV
jgi:hypothetical protein